MDTLQHCPSCGTEIVPSRDIHQCAQFPDMKARSQESIGCEEEQRSIEYYDVIVNYKEQTHKIKPFNILLPNGEVFGSGCV